MDISSLTVLQQVQEAVLVLALRQVRRHVAHEEGRLGAVRVLLQLQVEPDCESRTSENMLPKKLSYDEIEPGQFHQPDRLVAPALQHFPRNVVRT